MFAIVIDIMLKFDGNANAYVKCEKALRVHLPY